MCGIALLLSEKPNLTRQSLEPAMALMRHRGPDALEIFAPPVQTGGSLVMGHNLLQITGQGKQGVAAGAQPMATSDGRFFLLYNGEIYNYQTLRKRPEIQHISFQGETDTELLLHLLMTLRLEAIPLLQGMFAFVLVDSLTDTVIMARDHIGMKPLFYQSSGSSLRLASELSALLAIPGFEAKMNGTQITNYLKYKHNGAHRTIFKEVFQVKPGQVVIWSKGHLSYQTWFSRSKYAGSGHLNVPKVKSLLQAAVTSHLSQRHEAAILLSGGVDSTLLLANMEKLGIHRCTAYTAVPTGKLAGSDPDTYFAKEAQKDFRADWVPVNYDETILQHLPEYVSQLSTPIADGAGLLTWWLAKHTDPKHRVLISGAGADELFGGYNRHKVWYQYIQMPWLLSSPLTKSALLISSFFMPKAISQKLQFLRNALKKDARQTFASLTANGGWGQSNLIFPESLSLPDFPIDGLAKDQLAWGLNWDQDFYLTGDILLVNDAAGMMAGKEIRMPFLAPDLYHYITEVPQNEVLERGSKWVLKDLLSQLGGQKYAARRKKGFGLHLGELLRQPYAQPWLETMVNRPFWNQYIKPGALQHKWDLHRSGKADHGQALLSALILDMWLAQRGAF